jgi:membrane-bound lytic murein transglycosylase B
MSRALLALLLAACAAPEAAPSQDDAPVAPVDAPVAPADAPVAPPPPAPVGVEVPTDDEAVAALLARLEAEARDPAVDGAALESRGHLHQRVFRALASDTARAERVRAAVDPSLHQAFDAALEGTRRSGATVSRRRVDLPPWEIVPAPPIPTLLDAYDAAAAEFGVPWSVLAAIHLVETRMGRIRGTSHAGARGPMQFMPETWARYGEGEIDDTHDAIRAAARYLAAMGAARDLDKSLWHYNQSEHYVRAVRAFADHLAADREAYRLYWGWQVYYRTTSGDVWLGPGYAATERVPVPTWCAEPARCPDVSAGPAAPNAD